MTKVEDKRLIRIYRNILKFEAGAICLDEGNGVYKVILHLPHTDGHDEYPVLILGEDEFDGRVKW